MRVHDLPATTPAKHTSGFDALMSRLPWLGLAALIGAVAGFAASHVSPQRWEASATVQVASIAGDRGEEPRPVEPLAAAAARLKVPGFQDGVLKALGLPPDADNPESTLYRRSLVARPIERSTMMTLKVDGPSPERAGQYLTATIDTLKVFHEALARPTRERQRAQLAMVKARLASVEEHRARLEAQLEQRPRTGRSGEVADAGVLLTMTQQVATDAANLRNESLLLQEALTDVRSPGTSVIGAVHVQRDPVAPSRPLWAVVGAMLAIVLASAVVLLAASRRS